MENTSLLRLFFLLLTLVLLFITNKVTAQRPTEWYQINETLLQCSKLDGTPADYIETLNKVRGGIQYSMDDVVKNGVVVQTTMTLSDPVLSIKMIFYRGKERCEQAVARAKEKEGEDRRKLDKYR